MNIRRLFNLLLFCIAMAVLVIYTAMAGTDKKHASLFGKYSGLKKVITCTTRKGSKIKDFTRFNYKDAGFQKGGVWCDGISGPSGYYVLSKGKWHVWSKLNKKFKKQKTASINGKYKGLIKKFKRSQDKLTYKEFVEYGYQPYGLKQGHWGPEGFYVYLYPHWYIWEKTKKPKKIPDTAWHHIDYIHAYSDLKQIVYCPKDKGQYGNYYEYGEYGGSSSPYCGTYCAKGYWVYTYPNWYIWKSRKKVEDYRDVDPKAEWPPR